METTNNLNLRTNRIEALSDGIFAIAMTILVLSFEVLFEPAGSMSPVLLTDKLRALWPDLIHYVESFMILGVFWILQHRQLHFVKHANGRMLLLNILGLMFVALIPFSTVVVGDYGNMLTAALIFEANLFAAGIVFFFHWLYVTGKSGLAVDGIDTKVIFYFKMTNLMIPVISVVAIMLSIISPKLGVYLYFLIPIVLAFYRLK